MGTHKGSITRVADTAHDMRELLVTVGSGADAIAVAGVGDLPLGTCPDQPEAGDEAAVLLLGSAPETMEGVASGAVNAGERVCGLADGKLGELPTDSGTYYCVGTALETVADGEIFEFDPGMPYPVTVS